MSLTQDRLKELLHYDPETGVFTWRRDMQGKMAFAGQEAGSINSRGYREIGVDGRSYYAHRLAWLYMHGYLPNRIDHKNLNTSDNSARNIRECTQSSNVANSPMRKSNTTGIKGVGLHKSGKFTASITVNYRKIHLGYFHTKEAAAESYIKAAQTYFGEFARAA